MTEPATNEQMHGATKRGGRSAAAEAEPFLDAGLAAGASGAEMMVQASEAMSRGMAAIGQEVGRFVWQRLQADLEVSQSLLACKEIGTAIEVQRGFVGNTLEQYAEESRTLADLVAGMLRDSLPATGETRH